MSLPPHQQWEDEADDGSIVSSFSSRATATTDVPSSHDSDASPSRGRLGASASRGKGAHTSIFGTSAKDYNRSRHLVLGGGPSVGGIGGLFGSSPPRNTSTVGRSVLDDPSPTTAEHAADDGLGSFEDLPLSTNTNPTAQPTVATATGGPMLNQPINSVNLMQSAMPEQDVLLPHYNSAFGLGDREPPGPSLFSTLQQVEEQQRNRQAPPQQQRGASAVSTSSGYTDLLPRSTASAATEPPTPAPEIVLTQPSPATVPAVRSPQTRRDENNKAPSSVRASHIEGIPYAASVGVSSNTVGQGDGSPLGASSTVVAHPITSHYYSPQPPIIPSNEPYTTGGWDASSNYSSNNSYLQGAPPELHQTLPIDARPPVSRPGLPPTHPIRHNMPNATYPYGTTAIEGAYGSVPSGNFRPSYPDGPFATPPSDRFSSPDYNQTGHPEHITQSPVQHYLSPTQQPLTGDSQSPADSGSPRGKHKHRHKHEKDRDSTKDRKKDKKTSTSGTNEGPSTTIVTNSAHDRSDAMSTQRRGSVRGGVSVAGGGSVIGGFGNRNRSIQWGGGSQYGGAQSPQSPLTRRHSNLAGMVTIESSSGGLGRQNVFGGGGNDGGIDGLAFGGNLAASDRFGGGDGILTPRGPQSMGGGRRGGSSAGQIFPYNQSSSHQSTGGLGSTRGGGSIMSGSAPYNRTQRSDSGLEHVATQASSAFNDAQDSGSPRSQRLQARVTSPSSPLLANNTMSTTGPASPNAPGSVQGASTSRRNYIGIASSLAPTSPSVFPSVTTSKEPSLAQQYMKAHKQEITPATVANAASAAVEADENAKKQEEEEAQKSKTRSIGAKAEHIASNFVSGVADLFKVQEEEEDIMERRGRDAGRQYSDGYHLIPWDQRSTIPMSDDNNDNCSCFISPRFWERVDWAMRCTFLCVLPTAILTLLGDVNGRAFVLPGMTVVMALWVSQPTLGRGLRELYLAIKGGIPAYIISLILVWIHPANQWFWLGLFIAAVFVVALVSDEIKKPCCFFIASSFALYQITPNFTYKILTDLYVDILIGLAMGSTSFFIWKINWSLDRAKNHVVVLGNTAAVSIAGICSSFWTNSRLDRELNLVRIRQLKHTSARALAVIELSLNDAGFEPHNSRTIQQVRARRNLLHQIMGVINSTSNFIEVIADNPQWISTETCEEMGKCLNTELSMFGAAMDNYLLRICDFDKPVRLVRETPVPLTDMVDGVKQEPLPGVDKSTFLAARDKFSQSVERARQQVMLEDKNFKPSQSDIMLGFFLCSVEQMAEMLLKFEEPDTSHEQSSFVRAIRRPYDDFVDALNKLYFSFCMLFRGKITREVKESLKLALAMGLSALIEIVTDTQDPLSGSTLIPWVYSHDGLGTYNLMLMRVLGTVFGSIIAFMGAELVNQEVAGVICLIALFTLCGAFVQTSAEFSAAGNAFIWGVVSIAAKFDLRDVAIDRFTANVIAVLIYFFVSFVIWPNRMTSNIKEHLQKSLKAFRQATILLVKGVDDTPMRRYFKLVGNRKEGDDSNDGESDALQNTASEANNAPDFKAGDFRSPVKPRKTRSKISNVRSQSNNNGGPSSDALSQFRDQHNLQLDVATTAETAAAEDETTDSEEEAFDFATDFLPNADLILVDSHNEVDEFHARIRDQELSIPSCVKEPTMTTSAFPEDQWVKLVRSQKNLYHLLSLLRFSFETFAKSHVIGDSESIHWGLLDVMRVAAMDIGNMIFASIDLHLLMLEKITKVPTHFLVRLRGALVERQKQMEDAFLLKLGDLLSGADTGASYVEGAGYNFEGNKLGHEEDEGTSVFNPPSLMGNAPIAPNNAPDNEVFQPRVDDDDANTPDRPKSPASPFGVSTRTEPKMSPSTVSPIPPFPSTVENKSDERREPIADDQTFQPPSADGSEKETHVVRRGKNLDTKEDIDFSPDLRKKEDPLHDASATNTGTNSVAHSIGEEAAINRTAVFGAKSNNTDAAENADGLAASQGRLLKPPQQQQAQDGLNESRGASLQPPPQAQSQAPDGKGEASKRDATKPKATSPMHSYASSQFMNNTSIFGPASLGDTYRNKSGADLTKARSNGGDFALPIPPETPATTTTTTVPPAGSPGTIAQQAATLKALNEARVAAYTEERKANAAEVAKRLAKEEERRGAAALASGVGGAPVDNALNIDREKNLQLGREAFQLAQIQKQRQREAKAVLGNMSFLGNGSVLGTPGMPLGGTVSSAGLPQSTEPGSTLRNDNTFNYNSSIFNPQLVDNTSLFDRTTFLNNFSPSVVAAYNNLPAGEPITNQSFIGLGGDKATNAGTHLAAPSLLGATSKSVAASAAPTVKKVAAEDVATILGSTASTMKLKGTINGHNVDTAAAMAIADADSVAGAAGGGSKTTAMANSMRNKKQTAEQNIFKAMAQQLGIPPGLLMKKLAETRRMLGLGTTNTAVTANTATNKTHPNSAIGSPTSPHEAPAAGPTDGAASPPTAMATVAPQPVPGGPQPQPPTAEALAAVNGVSDPVTARLEALGDDALNKAIKVLVLSNSAIHSIEAFIFGVHALIQELGELEKGLLEMQHVEEINDML